ncbi:hypothetical protein [Janthinobacterium agaricidamnosum]|uniref:Uncharacterized protein n=1 Tax=Janthinobacterium agaricidamnosum NBRC 102515 = DSM 9628 TaxID=1349767 RepID=W0V245_9BURK|nr:hypothetical protein [Janthinobacterium agaricidamnosum]CDG81347.1 hypothetical protein GJA_688 [Janthinobacterium agaricidamnosum NBRC 102515 = DSM 9628]
MKSMTQGQGGQGAAPVHGSWTHSFEEDEPGVRVYRPTHSYAFPACRRGRETLEFGDDGKLTALAPGPDDRPRRQPALQLTPLGMNRYAVGGTAAAPEHVIEVLEATLDRLKLAGIDEGGIRQA